MAARRRCLWTEAPAAAPTGARPSSTASAKTSAAESAATKVQLVAETFSGIEVKIYYIIS